MELRGMRCEMLTGLNNALFAVFLGGEGVVLKVGEEVGSGHVPEICAREHRCA
jgi:hypothetical protein